MSEAYYKNTSIFYNQYANVIITIFNKSKLYNKVKMLDHVSCSDIKFYDNTYCDCDRKITNFKKKKLLFKK